MSKCLDSLRTALIKRASMSFHACQLAKWNFERLSVKHYIDLRLQFLASSFPFQERPHERWGKEGF